MTNENEITRTDEKYGAAPLTANEVGLMKEQVVNRKRFLAALIDLGRIDAYELFRRASLRVREEDLYGEEALPFTATTVYAQANQLAMAILRAEYKVFAFEEPGIAKGCPGFWELPSQRVRVGEIRAERRGRDV